MGIIKVTVELERDTDNSDPGQAEIAVIENSRGGFISLKLSGPDREIWLSRDHLLQAIAAFRNQFEE